MNPQVGTKLTMILDTEAGLYTRNVVLPQFDLARVEVSLLA
jgi:hypothetical protein